MKTVILMLFSLLTANAALAQTATEVKQIFARVGQILPANLSSAWNRAHPQFSVRVKRDMQTCIEYHSRMVHSQTRSPYREQTLDISRNCFSEITNLNPQFTLSDIKRSPLLKGLYQTAIRLWGQGKGSFIYRGKMKKRVFAHHYYFTPLTLGVDIYGSVKNSLLNFWTETILAYMTDAEFVYKHPDVYVFLRDKVFAGKEFFAQFYNENDLRLTSEDLYATRAKLKFLPSPSDAWYTRYHMIKNAKKTIYVQYFILADDIFGRSFVALLIQAMRERGVKVKVMLDGRGSLLTSRGRLMRALRVNGAEAVSYNPILLGIRNLFKFFNVGPISAFVAANHDKLILVDETKMLTGGRNIGQEYFLKPNESSKPVFKDADIYAEFERPFIPGISAFNAEFYSEHSFDVGSGNIDDGTKTTRECMASLYALEDRMRNATLSSESLRTHPELAKYQSLYGYNDFDPNPSEDYVLVKSLDKTSRLLDNNNFSSEIFELIRTSNRIVIQNPYIALTDRMKEALISAGQRGAKVIFNTTSPVSTDSAMVQAVFVHEWKSILRQIPNSEIYAITGPEVLHAKLFVFDRKKVIVGGYNMDKLSEKHNSEFGLLVDSEPFALMAEDSIMTTIHEESLRYDADRNIGPYSIAGAETNRQKLKFYYFLSHFLGEWL